MLTAWQSIFARFITNRWLPTQYLFRLGDRAIPVLRYLERVVPINGYLRQSQVAVGGLIGHNFGPAILQAYLTTDVYEKNYGGHDTRLWGRVILPLWTAPTAPPVATPLYRK